MNKEGPGAFLEEMEREKLDTQIFGLGMIWRLSFGVENKESQGQHESAVALLAERMCSEIRGSQAKLLTGAHLEKLRLFKGSAQMLGVETPNLDRCIASAEERDKK